MKALKGPLPPSCTLHGLVNRLCDLETQWLRTCMRRICSSAQVSIDTERTKLNNRLSHCSVQSQRMGLPDVYSITAMVPCTLQADEDGKANGTP
jgi:hypothetical protein